MGVQWKSGFCSPHRTGHPMTAALLQAAAFPAAACLIAWALIRLERALWDCDANEYCCGDEEEE